MFNARCKNNKQLTIPFIFVADQSTKSVARHDMQSMPEFSRQLLLLYKELFEKHHCTRNAV